MLGISNAFPLNKKYTGKQVDISTAEIIFQVINIKKEIMHEI